MKSLLTIILILGITKGYSQQPRKTIYANEHNTVAVIFPEPISQAITGAANFIFSFNKNQPQRFGLLKAFPGQNSNIFVVTSEGQMYSYLLEYREELPRWNYFIERESGIGKEVKGASAIAEKENSSPKPEVEASENKEKYYRKLSRIYAQTSRGKIKTKRKRGLKFTIKETIHYRQEVYLVMSLQNKSRIDFETGSQDFFITNGSKRRNASFQKLKQEELYRYNFPEVVKAGQSASYVLVFPKFTFGAKEKGVVQLSEKNGNRFLELMYR